MIYYISDLHIGHENVLRFDERPFADVEEMEREIIRRWNEKVRKKDDVYLLGDVFLRYRGNYADFLRQLHGRLHLIIGNHDRELCRDASAVSRFEDMNQIKTVKDNGRYVAVCHYPIISWDRKFYGSYHVYGHVHRQVDEDLLYMIKQEKAFNAGCMINGYAPCTLEELEQNNRLFRQAVLEKQKMSE